MSTHSVPIDNMSHIIDMLKEAIPVWDDFCLQLGIPETDIQCISGEVPMSDKYLTQMLNIWMQRNVKEATIDKLIAAVYKMNPRIATIICDKEEMKETYPSICKSQSQ